MRPVVSWRTTRVRSAYWGRLVYADVCDHERNAYNTSIAAGQPGTHVYDVITLKYTLILEALLD